MPWDLESNVAYKELLPAKQRTTTENGTGVDTKDYGGRGTAFLSVGAVSGTNPTLDVKLQESDDDSTYTDVSGATFAQLTAAGQEAIGVKVSETKRYLRAVATIGGTSPSFDCSVVLAAPVVEAPPA